MTTAEPQDYEVKLDLFEGPLDLLLHLIRKNEVDIFDIPISSITDQYLEYLDMMKALNISIAGDFLVMAATLIHIKSRMLLPGDPENEDEEDPRSEITRPLMEYLRIKEAAGELSERDILERDIFVRRPGPDDPAHCRQDQPIPKANLFQLMDAFKRVIEKHLPGAELTFRAEEWSLKDKMTHILDRLKKRSVFFGDLFSQNSTVPEMIATFLALLELVQAGFIRVSQHDMTRDILIEALFESIEDATSA